MLVAFIHTTGDGSWFWYATALRSGQHLYADLHLPMQPLYTIELATLMRVFGTSWLAQQIAGVLNLSIFTVSLALVNRHSRWPDWQKALVYAAAFWATMDFISMRFDDYHVLSASCELLCADALLHLKPDPPFRSNIGKVLTLGLLCGACLLNRLNDGALLTAAVMVVAAVKLRDLRGRLLTAIMVPIIASLAVAAVVTALGETLGNWFYYTVKAAAAIKGGTGPMWVYPLRLPVGTLRELFARGWRFAALTLYTVLAAAAAAWLSRDHGSTRTQADDTVEKQTAPRRWLIFGAVLFVVSLPFLKNIVHGNEARVIVAFAVLGMYAVLLWLMVEAVRSARKPRSAAFLSLVLLLLPISQLVSISLSAARWYPNTNPPAGLFLLLLPIAVPATAFRKCYRRPYVVLLMLLVISGVIDKIRDPFDWFYYRSLSINTARTWYAHPVYGRVLIEKDQLALMAPVCQSLHQDADATGEPVELLSMPFSFPNYFCHVQPWHGYMQTFYDTSSKATIADLETQLLQSPPRWIVYQRQLNILHENEIAFHNGQPLPHRDLDRLIMHQLQAGAWTSIQLKSPAYDKSTWLLIKTKPD